MKKLLPVLAVLIAALNGCDSAVQPERPRKPNGKFELSLETPAEGSQNTNSINKYNFSVRVADTYELRRRGLSGIKHLPNGEGMLFVMAKPTHMKMWMKECYIPLDVLFFDSEKKLINFHTMTVPAVGSSDNNLATYPSDKPAQYALELVGGTAERLGVKPGLTRISFSEALLKHLAEGTE